MKKPGRAASDVAPWDLPEGWSVLDVGSVGPFVTRVQLVRPDGEAVEWSSRRSRKRLGLRRPTSGRRSGRASASSWWMSALFSIGSICFALGSLPRFFDNVAPDLVAWTFFVGSIFFTSASVVQYHETRAAPVGVEPASAGPRGIRALLGWSPRRIDWWAAAVQLAGTLFFNATTFAATRTGLSTDQERRLIWGPDVAGSVCFLVASWLAYAEVNKGLRPRRDGSVGWWIAAVNLIGSIAFGAAAVASRYLRTTGEPANIALVNLGTFAGALCFLAGALLLPVESSTAENDTR